jgi:hypothetical protein
VSKPKAKRQEFINPEAGQVLSLRFVLSLVLIALGIAWVVFYYLVVRVDPLAANPGKAGGPSFMQDLKGWNYLVGFGLSGLGLMLAANPVTPLGRGRGVVVGMLGCFLLGLLWICTFYVVSNNIDAVPIMNDLGQKNLVVGIGLMAIGFAYATHWE